LSCPYLRHSKLKGRDLMAGRRAELLGVTAPPIRDEAAARSILYLTGARRPRRSSGGGLGGI
jgi:hypothetical protein